MEELLRSSISLSNLPLLRPAALQYNKFSSFWALQGGRHSTRHRERLMLAPCAGPSRLHSSCPLPQGWREAKVLKQRCLQKGISNGPWRKAINNQVAAVVVATSCAPARGLGVSYQNSIRPASVLGMPWLKFYSNFFQEAAFRVSAVAHAPRQQQQSSL